MQFREYLSALKDVETGQRGYLITGDKIYLEHYERSRAFIQSPQIQSLLDDYEMSPTYGEDVSKLRKLTTLKLDGLQKVINEYHNSGFQSAKEMVITNRGKDQMDNIRIILAKIHFEQQNSISSDEDQIQLKLFFDLMILINTLYIIFMNVIIYLPYNRSLVPFSKL